MGMHTRDDRNNIEQWTMGEWRTAAEASWITSDSLRKEVEECKAQVVKLTRLAADERGSGLRAEWRKSVAQPYPDLLNSIKQKHAHGDEGSDVWMVHRDIENLERAFATLFIQQQKTIQAAHENLNLKQAALDEKQTLFDEVQADLEDSIERQEELDTQHKELAWECHELRSDLRESKMATKNANHGCMKLRFKIEEGDVQRDKLIDLIERQNSRGDAFDFSSLLAKITSPNYKKDLTPTPFQAMARRGSFEEARNGVILNRKPGAVETSPTITDRVLAEVQALRSQLACTQDALNKEIEQRKEVCKDLFVKESSSINEMKRLENDIRRVESRRVSTVNTVMERQTSDRQHLFTRMGEEDAKLSQLIAKNCDDIDTLMECREEDDALERIQVLETKFSGAALSFAALEKVQAQSHQAMKRKVVHIDSRVALIEGELSIEPPEEKG